MRNKWLFSGVAALLCIGILSFWLVQDRDIKLPGILSASAETGVTVGKGMPSFSLADLNGQTVQVEPSGKIIVLNFWATWCPPCRGEMPELNEFAAKYQGKVAFYSIDLRESGDKVREYLERNHFSLPVLLDSDGAIGRQFMINAIPTTIIVDKNGVIQFRKTGAVSLNELESVIQGL